MRLRQPVWFSAAIALALSIPTVGFAQSIQAPAASSSVDHVLLISVDGMHAVDLEKYIAANPLSTFAALAKTGVRYTNASASTPSDSFPGVAAIATGGSAKSTGLYYETSCTITL